MAGGGYNNMQGLSGCRRLQRYGEFEWLEEVTVIWRVSVAGGCYNDIESLSGWRRLQ